MTSEPTLILHNGKFWTADPHNPWAEAVAVQGHTLLAVGPNEQVLSLARPSTEKIDLEGALAIPGLWDAHIHFYYWSLGLQQVQLSGCHNLEEMLDRIQSNLSEHSGNAWSTGWGWNETFWEK